MNLPCTAMMLAATWTGWVGAQTLIPLDSRPATRVLPAAMASLTGAAPRVPPAGLLGNASQGADVQALAAWLQEQSADQPLIVAVDTLAYGGLVQSRSSPLSVAEVLQRLQPLRDWQSRSGQPVYAFITLPREPDATNRQRNLEVVRAMLGWASQGVFRELHVTWDDALPGSPAPQEAAQLALETPPNVRVYPGADEVLSLLVARALRPESRNVRIEYSDPQAAQQVIKYEGISLAQSAINHAQATGFQVTDSPADLTLYVFNGGDARQAALRISALLRLGAVAVADVEQVNQGNARLWADLTTLRQHANLRALAAWGTPGNNLGSALAHARLTLDGVNAVRQDALLAREYANDVIFSSHLRPELRQAIPEAQLADPAAPGVLLKLAQRYFPIRIGNEYLLQNASLPWNRSFEWDFQLIPRP